MEIDYTATFWHFCFLSKDVAWSAEFYFRYPSSIVFLWLASLLISIWKNPIVKMYPKCGTIYREWVIKSSHKWDWYCSVHRLTCWSKQSDMLQWFFNGYVHMKMNVVRLKALPTLINIQIILPWKLDGTSFLTHSCAFGPQSQSSHQSPLHLYQPEILPTNSPHYLANFHHQRHSTPAGVNLWQTLPTQPRLGHNHEPTNMSFSLV